MNADVKIFWDAIAADEALRQKLMADATGGVESLLRSAVKEGAGRGYTFTAEEARAFADELTELPDEMLELIAAGSTCTVSVQRSQL